MYGAGNIGQAIANYRFNENGLDIAAIFDANPKLVGIKIRDVEIRDIDYLDTYLEENNIDMGIICVPRNNAQTVCDRLIKGGVKGIWNFAPVDLIFRRCNGRKRTFIRKFININILIAWSTKLEAHKGCVQCTIQNAKCTIKDDFQRAENLKYMFNKIRLSH